MDRIEAKLEEMKRLLRIMIKEKSGREYEEILAEMAENGDSEKEVVEAAVEMNDPNQGITKAVFEVPILSRKNSDPCIEESQEIHSEAKSISVEEEAMKSVVESDSKSMVVELDVGITELTEVPDEDSMIEIDSGIGQLQEMNSEEKEYMAVSDSPGILFTNLSKESSNASLDVDLVLHDNFSIESGYECVGANKIHQVFPAHQVFDEMLTLKCAQEPCIHIVGRVDQQGSAVVSDCSSLTTNMKKSFDPGIVYRANCRLDNGNALNIVVHREMLDLPYTVGASFLHKRDTKVLRNMSLCGQWWQKFSGEDIRIGQLRYGSFQYCSSITPGIVYLYVWEFRKLQQDHSIGQLMFLKSCWFRYRVVGSCSELVTNDVILEKTEAFPKTPVVNMKTEITLGCLQGFSGALCVGFVMEICRIGKHNAGEKYVTTWSNKITATIIGDWGIMYKTSIDMVCVRLQIFACQVTVASTRYKSSSEAKSSDGVLSCSILQVGIYILFFQQDWLYSLTEFKGGTLRRVATIFIQLALAIQFLFLNDVARLDITIQLRKGGRDTNAELLQGMLACCRFQFESSNKLISPDPNALGIVELILRMHIYKSRLFSFYLEVQNCSTKEGEHRKLHTQTLMFRKDHLGTTKQILDELLKVFERVLLRELAFQFFIMVEEVVNSFYASFSRNLHNTTKFRFRPNVSTIGCTSSYQCLHSCLRTIKICSDCESADSDLFRDTDSDKLVVTSQVSQLKIGGRLLASVVSLSGTGELFLLYLLTTVTPVFVVTVDGLVFQMIIARSLWSVDYLLGMNISCKLVANHMVVVNGALLIARSLGQMLKVPMDNVCYSDKFYIFRFKFLVQDSLRKCESVLIMEESGSMSSSLRSYVSEFHPGRPQYGMLDSYLALGYISLNSLQSTNMWWYKFVVLPRDHCHNCECVVGILLSNDSEWYSAVLGYGCSLQIEALRCGVTELQDSHYMQLGSTFCGRNSSSNFSLGGAAAIIFTASCGPASTVRGSVTYYPGDGFSISRISSLPIRCMSALGNWNSFFVFFILAVYFRDGCAHQQDSLARKWVVNITDGMCEDVPNISATVITDAGDLPIPTRVLTCYSLMSWVFWIPCHESRSPALYSFRKCLRDSACEMILWQGITSMRSRTYEKIVGSEINVSFINAQSWMLQMLVLYLAVAAKKETSKEDNNRKVYRVDCSSCGAWVTWCLNVLHFVWDIASSSSLRTRMFKRGWYCHVLNRY